MTVLKIYPNVRVLLDHVGNPVVENGPLYVETKSLFDLAQYASLWLKSSTQNIHEAAEGNSTVEEFFGRLVDAFGAHRLMWGSNFPAAFGSDSANPKRSLEDPASEELKVLGAENQRWMLAEARAAGIPKSPPQQCADTQPLTTLNLTVPAAVTPSAPHGRGSTGKSTWTDSD